MIEISLTNNKIVEKRESKMSEESEKFSDNELDKIIRHIYDVTRSRHKERGGADFSPGKATKKTKKIIEAAFARMQDDN